MKSIVQIIAENLDKVLLDEDGNHLTIRTAEPLPMEIMRKFEEVHNIDLPLSLKDLLLFSNGILLFGEEIFSLEMMDVLQEEQILVFHSWGNGDFDGILLTNDRPNARVVFMCHSSGNLFTVVSSLTEWVHGVIEEIKMVGALLHPLDYLNRNDKGLYSNLNKLTNDGNINSEDRVSSN